MNKYYDLMMFFLILSLLILYIIYYYKSNHNKQIESFKFGALDKYKCHNPCAPSSSCIEPCPVCNISDTLEFDDNVDQMLGIYINEGLKKLENQQQNVQNNKTEVQNMLKNLVIDMTNARDVLPKNINSIISNGLPDKATEKDIKEVFSKIEIMNSITERIQSPSINK